MLSKAHTIQWLRQLTEVYKENKEYLTDLDSAIGDADHGINLARGFIAVLDKLKGMDDKDIGTMFKTTGITLISKVGGASGPLYGTFFMRAAVPAGSTDELDDQTVLEVLKAGAEGIVQRGRAEIGDKTMVDVWSPALETLEAELNDGKDLKAALRAMTARAEEAMQATTPLQARKGRASYLGERSIGHQDPGATSSYLMIKTLSDIVNDD
jgi:phosphoenolpyruvate---glycerone phosphotransferase subunit DhaL